MAVKDHAFWKVKQHLPDDIEWSHKIKLKLSIIRRVLHQKSSHHLVLLQQRPLVALLGQRICFMQAVSIFPHTELEGGWGWGGSARAFKSTQEEDFSCESVTYAVGTKREFVMKTTLKHLLFYLKVDNCILGV